MSVINFAGQRKRVYFIFAFALAAFCGGGFAFYGPAYLNYADGPSRCDVIVLFLGPDFEAREQEALALVNEGYATKIMVPDCHALIEKPAAHDLDALRDQKSLTGCSRKLSADKNYPIFFEKTHLEVLTARKMMETLGLKSALLVSSPYHMRRIKLISGREMEGSGIGVSLVPACSEPPCGHACTRSIHNLYMAIGEYVKIAWFLVYGFFS